MASPTWVGSGLNYDATTAFPSSLEIPAPAGVQRSDRVVAFVVCQGSSGGTAFTCSTPTGWTLIGSETVDQSFRITVFVLTAQWDGTAPSVSLARTTGTSNLARVHTGGWRPSKPGRGFNSSVHGFSNFGDNTMTFSTSFIESAHVFAVYESNAFGGLFPTDVVINQSAITNRGGPFKLSTKSYASVTSGAGTWSWTGGNGVGVSFLLDAASADPDLPALSQWGVDQVRW